jgi:hypothetical protein
MTKSLRCEILSTVRTVGRNLLLEALAKVRKTRGRKFLLGVLVG